MNPDILVRVSPDVLEHLFTRDASGNRLHVAWGEPDAAGFHSPTVTQDTKDNLLAAERARIRAAVEGLPWFAGRAAVLAAIDGDACDKPDRSRPCATDPRCCRWQGHDGDHMYPDGADHD